LGGRAAGVNVMENNSEPGGGINIEIRGVSSISGSTQPLYVIDGVPIEQPDMNLNGSNQISTLFGNNLTANPLSMLNQRGDRNYHEKWKNREAKNCCQL
jgi:TonB-dependent starch-binding outer membrane protein SusC